MSHSPNSKPLAISATMQRALDDAKLAGGRLYRWPGGFWLNRAKADGAPTPQHGTYFDACTIKALIARSKLRVVAHLSRGDPWIVELIP